MSRFDCNYLETDNTVLKAKNSHFSGLEVLNDYD